MLGEHLGDSLAEAAGRSERSREFVERFEVCGRGDVPQRIEQIRANPIRGHCGAHLLREQMPPTRRLMECVRDLGDRVLQAGLRRQRPNKGEEVGQFAQQLGLAFPRSVAQILGREDVADERRGEGDQEDDRHDGAQGDTHKQDPAAEHELRCVYLRGRYRCGVETRANDRRLVDLRGERWHLAGQPSGDRGDDPFPPRLLRRHEALIPFTRECHGTRGFEAPGRGEPRAEDRHEQAEDRDRDRDGAKERQQHRYTSRRVTRQDSQMPANSRHTAAGSSTNRPNPVSNTGATRSWLASSR